MNNSSDQYDSTFKAKDILRRTIHGGGGFLVANVARKALGFLFVVIAARLLGPKGFGILALALSAVRVIQKVSLLGLPDTIQRTLSGNVSEDREGLYGTILLAACIMAILGGGLTFASAPVLAGPVFDEPSVQGPIRILSVWVVLMVLFTVMRGVLQSQEEVGGIIIIDTLRQGAKVILLVVMVLVTRSVAGAAWAVAVSAGVGVGVAVKRVCRLSFEPIFSMWSRHFGQVVDYALPMTVIGLSYLLARQADRLMLGIFGVAEDVGVYTVASTLAMLLGVVHGSLVAIFKPLASGAFRANRTDELRETYLFIGKWGCVLSGILLILVAGAGSTILDLVGSGFESQATYISLLLLTGLYFVGTWVGPTGALLQMTGGHKVELVNTSVFLSSNVLLNWVLITRYGIVGAASATFLSGALRNLLQVIELKVMWDFSPLNRPQIVHGMIIIGGCGLGMLLKEGVVRSLAFSVVIMIVVFLFVQRIDSSEKRLMANGWDAIYEWATEVLRR